MADVSAVFGTLLALGIAFPGLLTAWWLIFPATVSRAEQRFVRTPWRCFWMGLFWLPLIALPTIFLMAVPVAPVRALGIVAALAAVGMATLGAAGIAAGMGQRLDRRAGGGLSRWGAFLRGAIALELAAIFPLLGWLLVIPVTILVALGASIFALLHWVPRGAPSTLPGVSPLPQGRS